MGADGDARFDFKVMGRDLLTFYRLQRRLPVAEKRRSDGGDVNRNEGLGAKLRSRLNRLGRATSGYSKKLETLANSLALVWLREGLI